MRLPVPCPVCQASRYDAAHSLCARRSNAAWRAERGAGQAWVFFLSLVFAARNAHSAERCVELPRTSGKVGGCQTGQISSGRTRGDGAEQGYAIPVLIKTHIAVVPNLHHAVVVENPNARAVV